MDAVLSDCTVIEQRAVVRFLWAEGSNLLTSIEQRAVVRFLWAEGLNMLKCTEEC
jgi:hypothetical protein